MKPDRAWVLLPSGRRLNLLEPDPWAWTDRDLAIGLSRTYRWAGYSAWDLPLSVTQHSLTVLALRTASAGGGFTEAEARRELLHDATEALLGGWDPITPLKPHLGDGFHRLVARLQAALDERYQLPAWDDAAYRRHKHADHLAAASEAFHVAGWSRDAMRNDLQIAVAPLEDDPLAPQPGFRPWEPWPPKYATERFLVALQSIWPDRGAPADRLRRFQELAAT
jgi:5'-nucleotidase